MQVGIIENRAGPLAFSLQFPDGTFRILKASAIGGLLLSVVGLEPLKELHFATGNFAIEQIQRAIGEVINLEYLVPKHSRGIVRQKSEIGLPREIDSTQLKFRLLGKSRVEVQ